MIFLKAARRVWGLYTRLFRVITISCDLKEGNHIMRRRSGWEAMGFDPQFKIYPKKTNLPPGWYRLSYDAYHTSGDALFIPKIYPLHTLEKAPEFESLFPKGFGEKSEISIFTKAKQEEALKHHHLTTSKKEIKQEKGGSPTLPESRDTDASDQITETNIFGPKINLRPHLPGQTQHLFRYAFEPEGFRFDPFDADYPRTWQSYHGAFQLNNFRMTFLGLVPFLLFSIHHAIIRADRRWRFRKTCTALQLLRKKGKSTLMDWLAHKAYLKIQPPFSPTSWYRFFCDSVCFDTNSIDWFSELSSQPTFALFLFVGESDSEQLSGTMQTVLSQSYPLSEIFILTSSTSHPKTVQQANLLVKKHSRIRKMHCLPKDFGQALEETKSEFICLIESGDQLRNHTVARLAKAVADNKADITYGDEVVLTESGDRIQKVVLRPAFCLDHFLNNPCIGLMTAIRRDLLGDVGLPTDCISIEVLNEKLILNALVMAKKIVHIPDLIFERLTPNKAPFSRRLPPSVIGRFLERQGFTHATVNTTANAGLYSIRYNHPVSRKTAIIIPTKNNGDILKIAIEALERTIPEELYDLVVVNHESDDSHTLSLLRAIAKKHRVIDYRGKFNFSKINNFAVKQLAGANDSFLFINNDVEAINPGWFESMRDKLCRKEVGIVGATLIYPPEIKTFGNNQENLLSEPVKIKSPQLMRIVESGGTTDFKEAHDYKIQHAGVIMNVGVAEHYLKGEIYENKYVQGSNTNPAIPAPVTRSFIAVTAACMMTRRDVFEEIGSFDEELAVGFQDVDLCLRAGNEGYKVLCDAEAVLFHHESMTRSTNDFLSRDPHPADTTNFRHKYQHDIGRDPFYHPMLANSTPLYRPMRSINPSYLSFPRGVTNLGLTPYEAQSD